MELTGKLKSIGPTYESPQWELNLTVNEATKLRNSYQRLKGKDLDIKISVHRVKRSLDANAYYWVLLSKYAEHEEISKTKAHNMMLKDYGQVMKIDGGLVTVEIPETETSFDEVEQAETYHLKPTSQVRPSKKGQLYRTYIMLRGSHSYDKSEFSHLLNGLITECENLGIETATPEELERMMSLWQTTE